MRLFIERVGVVLKRSLGLILLLSISGTSVALATLTFTSTSMTTDNFVGLLGGLVGVGATTTGVTFYVQSQSVGTTTVQLQGLAGQTARLFAVASSSGVNSFEILASGVASSSNFTSTSSTFSGTLLVSGSAFAIASAATSTSLALLQGSVVGSTTLNIVGFLNQTANLVTVASNTGVPFFVVGPTGVASSTEFRSPSSTVSVLTVPTSLTVSTGTAITNIACASKSYNLGSISGWATSSVPFTLTGISTSSNQTFQFGFATSSAGFDALQLLGVIASSTNNAVNAYVRNNASTTLASATTTYSLCFTQF